MNRDRNTDSHTDSPMLNVNNTDVTMQGLMRTTSV